MSKAPASAVFVETETALLSYPQCDCDSTVEESRGRVLLLTGFLRLGSLIHWGELSYAMFSGGWGSVQLPVRTPPLLCPSAQAIIIIVSTKTPPQTLLGGDARLCSITGPLHLMGKSEE